MKKSYILLIFSVTASLQTEQTFRDWKRKRDWLINQSLRENRHVAQDQDELYYAKQDMDTAKDRNHYPEYWIMEREYYQDQEHLFDELDEKQAVEREIENF